MMIRKFHAGAGLALLLQSSVLPAEPQVANEKWVLDYAPTQCLAFRRYGPTDKPTILTLKPSPVSDVMQLSIVKPGGTRDNSASETTGKIRINDSNSIEASILSVSTKGGIKSYQINLTGPQAAALASATRLRIVGEEVNESLVLSQMPQLMKSVASCTADLRRYWNITPELQANIKARSTGTLVGLFNPDDYPGIALFQNQEGAVQVSLLIDEEGKVAECAVTETSKVAALDAQVCFVLSKRAKFKPAIGANGKPTRDSYSQRITWRIPG
jgi:TonB family protein